MNDRELLEYAAKVSGYKIEAFGVDGVYVSGNGFMSKFFNPLTDDGDALRLATELELNIFHAANSAYAMPSDDDGTNEQQVSYSDAGGKNVATRLAIVRAAAEIGKDIK